MADPTCKCGNTIDRARLALGLRICIECGQRAAEALTAKRAHQILPAFNKGAYTLVSNRDDLKAAGRKEAQVFAPGQTELKPAYGMRVTASPKTTQRKRVIGMYYRDGDRVLLYEGQTAPAGCRVVYL